MNYGRRANIYEGLKKIGGEIAAFYSDGCKIYDDSSLRSKGYLLMHAAREIDGGIRDIWDFQRPNAPRCKQCNHALAEKNSHLKSICRSLGVGEEDPLSGKWAKVARQLTEQVHRHGAFKKPREPSRAIQLWDEFEDVLEDLVGSFYLLTDRVDRLLECDEPSPDVLGALFNLLKVNAINLYAFKKLRTEKWLLPLKEQGWFEAEHNPGPKEVEGQPGFYTIPFWPALVYLEMVAKKNEEKPCNEITEALLEIANGIISYRDEKGERIDNYRTDWVMTKIIFMLPAEKWSEKHIDFILESLGTQFGATLVESEIGKIVLPHLIENKATKLILRLLDKILGYNVKTDGGEYSDKITPIMEKYWLNEILGKHKPAIAELCGIEAAKLCIDKIRAALVADEGQFNDAWVRTIEDHPETQFPDRYGCQLVYFVRDMLENSEPKEIRGVVEGLLKEKNNIFRRISIHIINRHYEELKELFWNWPRNPFGKEEIDLTHEVHVLLKTRCKEFDDNEVKTVLDWIENADYGEFDNNKEGRRHLAYCKKRRLLAVLENDNPAIKAAYEKYDKVFSGDIEHPGFTIWSEGGWYGSISPIEKPELLSKSNEEIAEYLKEWKGEDGWKMPSQEGLADSLAGAVIEDPARFAKDMGRFLDVPRVYQDKLVEGLHEAWKAKRDFELEGVFQFINELVKDEKFWAEEYREGQYNYRNWMISEIARFIQDGTEQKEYAFDERFFPQVENILLILAERTKSELSESVELIGSVINASEYEVFAAMVYYSVQYWRLNKEKEGAKWPQAVKKDFDQRLDKPKRSLVYSVVLGRYLQWFCRLDKKWVTKNVNRIFPKEDEEHWEATFSAYLSYSLRVYPETYSLLRKNNHYDKALQTKFKDEHSREKIVQHICIAFLNDWEKLDDSKSLFCQLLQRENAQELSEVVNFLWSLRKSDEESVKKVKERIRAIWKVMLELLEKRQEKREYQAVISGLHRWLDLVDEIDDEIKKWAKLTAKYIRVNYNDSSLVRGLGRHVEKRPGNVGEIYVEMLNGGAYPGHPEDKIKKVVECLYKSGCKKYADTICNMYGEVGMYFLRELYEEYRNNATGGI